MFSKKTFCLFLPQAITLKLICGSGVFWHVQQTLRYRTGVDFVGVDLLILPTGSMDIQLYKISNLASTRILNAACILAMFYHPSSNYFVRLVLKLHP